MSPEYRRPPRAHDLEAEIHCLPTEFSGRKHALFSGYRPNHTFQSRALYDAQHEYPDGAIAPGESGRALLWLLSPDRQTGRLYEGMQFTVQEAMRVVGVGVITRLKNKSLERRDDSSRFEGWWNDFRATGSIHPIRLGMTPQDVRRLLGSPDGDSIDRRADQPFIVKYGAIEFHFRPSPEGGRLELIYSDDSGVVEVSIGGRLFSPSSDVNEGPAF